MPKSNKTTSNKMKDVPNQDEASTQEDSSSEQEIDQEVTLNPPQVFSSMFIPYIEGLRMDWTVNDGLFSRFFEMEVEMQKYT